MMTDLPKLVLSDIDGVWTDGGMYYDQKGNEWKRFNTYDSAGVLYCHLYQIQVGIITGEETDIVKRRAKKLKIDHLFLGATNKLKLVKDLSGKLNITLDEIAYIGDDINDYALLQHVGFSAAPANATKLIKDSVSYVTKCRGGEGAFREFVLEFFLRNGISENDLYERYNANSQSKGSPI